jgi:hypothetical protein
LDSAFGHPGQAVFAVVDARADPRALAAFPGTALALDAHPQRLYLTHSTFGFVAGQQALK